jgi:ATP-dependent protease ClpP protease subunit
MKKTKNNLQIFGIAGVGFMALANKYPLTIKAEAKDNVAEIHISGIIHDYQNSAEQFKKRIAELTGQGIKDVTLYINSPGGSVFEANEIANEIERFTGTIKGYGGAVVASAASYLAMICETFEMAENGQFMYHKPHGQLQGNEDEMASNLKLLQSLTKHYRKKYAEKTGMTEDEIEESWSKGDVWLTAEEALEQGFITGILKKKAEITEDEKEIITACGSPYKPRVNVRTSRSKNNVTDNVLAVALGLNEYATNNQVNQQIDALANQALLDKKIDAKQLDNLKAMLKDSPKSTIEFLALKPALVKISDHIVKGGKAGRESWSLDDWRKNDPKYLQQNPDFYQSLVSQAYDNK